MRIDHSQTHSFRGAGFPRVWSLLLLTGCFCVFRTTALVTVSTAPSTLDDGDRSQLIRTLQSSCFTPQDVLDRVGRHISPSVDPSGEVASLVLVRLSKQCITLANQQLGSRTTLMSSTAKKSSNMATAVVSSLLESSWRSKSSLGYLVEGTKAYSVISRLFPEWTSTTETVQNFWHGDDELVGKLVPWFQNHEISGLHWALENMVHSQQQSTLKEKQVLRTVPDPIKMAWNELNLPFRIIPGLSSHTSTLSYQNLNNEIEFVVDQIQTASETVVPERRGTSWQGDDGVMPFMYGGKAMPTQPWSPTVLLVRDTLSSSDSLTKKHQQFYDCALINHYPNGGSGMRYHSDPDQGTLWDYDTAVVSVGATRRFSFRSIPSCGKTSAKQNASHIGQRRQQQQQHHSFYVMHGDVTHMFGSCQEEYQHCVKKAEHKSDDSPRISLVFKRSWGYYNSG